MVDVFFGGGGEDVNINWKIIRGPLGQLGDNMGLFRIIWYQIGVIMGQWG